MSTDSDIDVRLVRNATLLVTVGETTFLVDPMFSSPGENPPAPNSPNDRRNPLVPMPDVDLPHDAVIVTHRHPDHFDEAAREELDANVPLFRQPTDADAFADEGFTDVRPVADEGSFDGVTVHRTPGRHGHGQLAEEMGPVSGFVLDADGTLYIAGDTVWYDAVERTLDRFDPTWWFSTAAKRGSSRGNPSRWASRTSPPSATPPTPRSSSFTWGPSTTASSRVRNCDRRRKASTFPRTESESSREVRGPSDDEYAHLGPHPEATGGRTARFRRR